MTDIGAKHAIGLPRLRLPHPRDHGVYYALLALALVVAIIGLILGSPGFFTPRNVANILSQSALVSMLAVTMTIVLITGNFDLSVAATAALSAAVLMVLVDAIGVHAALAAAILTGGVIGLVNGLIVYRLGINAFIVTLGTLTAIRGLLLIVTGSRTVAANDPAGRAVLSAIEGGRWSLPSFVIGAIAALVIVRIVCWVWNVQTMRAITVTVGATVAGAVLGALLIPAWPLAKPVYYTLAITAAANALLRYTIIGRRIFAVGANTEAARLLGIPVGLYKITPFVLNGLVAAIVGILFASRLGAVSPLAMQGMELTVIAAAILGGTSLYGGSGSVLKSVAGALVLFTIGNGFNLLNLSANFQGLIEGVVIIAAAALYTVSRRKEK